MKFGLAITRDAEQDIAEIKAWYDSQQDGLSLRFAEEIGDLLARIQAWPRSFRRIERGYRRAKCERFPYAVLYKLIEQVALVVAIVHTSRGNRYLRSRLP